jgi:hypothetical protein
MKRLSLVLLFALLASAARADVVCVSNNMCCQSATSGGVTASGNTAFSGNNTFTGTDSFVDNNFSIVGSSDATKILKFEVDGFTTATTHTATFPDANATVAVLNRGTAQTFTDQNAFNGVYINSGGYVLMFGNPTFANPSNVSMGFRTEQTPDTMMLGTPAISNSFVIAETADITYDFAHPQQTDPTLFIHSHNQSTTQWMSLAHDATNGVISTGAGALVFSPAGNQIVIPTGKLLYFTDANGGGFYSGAGSPLTDYMWPNTASNAWVFVDSNDAGFNFAHPQQATPTIFFHSGAQNTTDWGSVTHNTTDFILGSGAGGIRLAPAGHVKMTGTAPAVTSCGTSPSTVTGSDHAGTLTTGSGAGVQSCTLTFAVAWTVAPSCVVSDETAILLVRATSTTTTLVFDSAVAGTLASSVLKYICIQGS